MHCDVRRGIRGRVIALLIAGLGSSLFFACEGGTELFVADVADVAVGVADSTLVADVAADTSVPDLVFPDVSEPDVAPPVACQPGDGCFGEPCGESSDCLSGICTAHMGDKVCSKTCDELCPTGWSCSLVGSGSDGQYVCMSQFSALCLPCETSEGCVGDTPNACVRYEGGSSFCGGACDLETPCPDAYGCHEVETVNGAKSYQCVLDEGLCDCSVLATDSALSTPCIETNEHGSCEGARICDQEGLSDCSAAPPAPEICNGVDDDCNGFVDDATCDDENPCTQDTCLGEGGCEHVALEAGECLDGDACTQGDHCVAGVCVGESLECADDNPCTDDSCDQGTGCQYLPNTLDCSDGDACTLGDTCKEAACAPGVAVVCDDNNPCTDDSCGPNGCVFAPHTGQCDDQNACTSASACLEGSCVGSAATVCDDGNPCTSDACQPATGCDAAPNALPCDDGDACTLGDVCAEGACSAGDVSLQCDDSNPCTDDACDGAFGCAFVPNAAPCDDQNTCTTSDACDQGACIGTGSLACDDANPCTVDICSPDGGCDYAFVDTDCSDGDPCTVGDLCNAGLCESGSDVSCDDGNPCTDELCAGGSCIFTANDAPCDDGNACSIDEQCAGGACSAQGALSCDDGNPCTNDGCEPGVGCTHEPNDLPCWDGDACTVEDTCVEGVCAGGGPLGCDDGQFCNGAETCDALLGCQVGQTPILDDANACTADSCDEATDQVVHAPQGASCDNGLFCDGVEGCDIELGCQAGTPPETDDGIDCTTDSCDELLGAVVHTPVHSSCDNGVFCDGLEFCELGSGCQSGAPPTLDDGLGCTVDACDEDQDTVVHTPDDGLCDNGQFCDGAEVCHGQAGCLDGAPPSIGDGLACTADSCDEVTDTLVHAPVDGVCDNGVFCDGVETCDAEQGCLGGVPPDPEDGLACTEDSCDENTNTLVNTPNHASCDNGLFCDGSEVCDPLGGCQSGQAPALDDGVACTASTCDENLDAVLHEPDDAQCPDGDGCQVGVCHPTQGCLLEGPQTCCGNNVIEPGESCDDGNQNDGDGCSAVCQLPAECLDHAIIDDATRKESNGFQGSSCDSGLEGWSRIAGAAGTKLLENCPSVNTCGTQSPGWMQGGHPTTGEGQVDRTVCFNWSGNCCLWSRVIQVRNCGDYYVYNLHPTPECNLKYCTAD